MTPTHTPSDQRITIRPVTPGDGPALTRLVQLDSTPPLREAPALVAEVDGELVAALPLDGDAIANPFRHTAGIVSLLEARAAELEGTARRAPRARWTLGSLRFSLAGRA